jgi:hypothetical protein
LGGRSKSDRLALLTNREGRKEDRNDPVLPKGHSIVRVSGYLEKEVAVPTLVHELACRKPPDWEPAENERAGTETKGLRGFISFEPDQFASFCPI